MFDAYTTSWSAAGEIVATAALLLAGIVVVVRVVGLRSFSKMSSTDFAITVAIGSILGSVATSTTVPLVHGLLAVATLLGVKVLVAIGRRHGLDRLVDNDPIVVMVDGDFLDDNLAKANMSRADMTAKLREANVLALDDVRAVVVEATGDVSVLHGDKTIDHRLLHGVVDSHRVRTI